MKSVIQVFVASFLLFACMAVAQTGSLTTGYIYTYGGTGGAGYGGDGNPAIDAEFNLPIGVIADAAGNLYIADGNENRVRKIEKATGVITTVAGTGVAAYGGDGGPATEAELNNPVDVALDAKGNLYIADAWNACVRKVDATSGIITTYAGTCGVLGEKGNGGPADQAQLILPLGLAIDAAGDVYISDDSRVHKVDAVTGIISTFAGTGVPGTGGDGGPAFEATLEYPIGIAVDSAQDVYIVDPNANEIRKVQAGTGIISTVAGTGIFGYSADGGLAVDAELAQPNFIRTDGSGNLYISDSSSSRIRKVDAQTGIITTVAGNGTGGFSGDDGPAVDAQMSYPEGLSFDRSGNLYIGDSFNNRIRLVSKLSSSTLIATTTSLTASASTLTVGQQLTLTATVVPASGATPTGSVSFFAGTTSLGSATVNASGEAILTLTPTAASYSITATYNGSTNDAPSTSSPVTVNVGLIATVTDLSVSATNLTVGQPLTLTATVTAASGPAPSGAVSFLYAGKSLGNSSLNSGGVATLTVRTTVGQFSITADYDGNTVDASSVSNSVGVTVTQGPTKLPNIYVYAGNGNPGVNGDGCSAATAELNPVFSLASDAAGNLYIADFEGNRIRRVDRLTGIITTVAGNGTKGFSGDGGPATGAELNAPYGVAIDAAGNLYIADTDNYRIRKVVLATGIITTVAGTGTHGYSGDGALATTEEIGYVYGVGTDAQGNLYIGDDSNFRIRKVNAVTGIITTVAGDGAEGYGGDGQTATSAELFGLLYPALDASGNLYISDTANNRIRRVDAVTGIITTVAGDGVQGYGGDGGPATDAEIYNPGQIASDAVGNITIADVFNNRIRRVDAATGIITTVAGDGVQGFGPIGDPAIYAELNEPTAVAIDAAGNLYIDVNGVTQILIVGAEPNFPLIATTTGLVAAPTTLLAGQTLSLTATVASTCAAPGGTVSFLNGAAPLGSASLNGSGVATLALTPAVGNYSITASYSGSAIDAPSESAPPVEVTVSTGLISTTTSLSALSTTTLTVGQTLTVRADVSAASGVTPTGKVTFYNGAISLGTGQLNASGQVTLQLTPAVGSYSITASYAGSSLDAPSASSPPIKVTVSQATTTTTLIATPTALAVGKSLTLTATVTASSGPTPTGTVTFNFSGPSNIASLSATLNAQGMATATISTLPVGVYRIFASYGGSSSDAASNSSPPITVTVTTPATNTSLEAAPNPAAFGANVTFTATVTNSTSTPTGSVSFYDGKSLLGTETLASGVATYSTSVLSAGSHNITAVYTPTPAFSASTSDVLVEVVSITSFSIVAAPASQTVYTGESASYLVAITPTSGFTLPIALSCTQPPANTTCSFSPATVPAGSGTSVVVVQTTAPSPSKNTSASATRYRVTALAALFLFFIPWRLRRNRSVWTAFIAIFAFFAAAVAITACSGGGALSGGTPVGADTITIAGTATNGANSLSQQATVTLNVKSLF